MSGTPTSEPKTGSEETTTLDAKKAKGKTVAKGVKRKRTQKLKDKQASGRGQKIEFPKDALSKCLRIPQAILEQNAGKECTDREAAGYAKLKYTGEVAVEISSASKFGLLERPASGSVKPTDLVRKIVRPQKPSDRLEAMREAVLKAPIISDVYKHYRGENLPEREFLVNTAIDNFKVPRDRVESFVTMLLETLRDAELLEEASGKTRVLDITHTLEVGEAVGEQQLKKLGKGVSVQSTDTCFVMMPFLSPLGSYYSNIYEPAIKKAGLTPVRADTDIFGTGKIIDQIWSGINVARVLVAELTGRNPNVLYELGLAHALYKPVVLISSNEQDVPSMFATFVSSIMTSTIPSGARSSSIRSQKTSCRH